MRILFICGRIEPGADGVGDYTRSLASALSDLGHDVAIAAIADSIQDNIEGSIGDIATLRVPSSLDWSQKEALLARFTAAFAPNWISIQFVPWSFGNKGCVVAFTDVVAKCAAAAGAQIHMMLHELWLVPDSGPWRHRMLGYLQRACIRRFLIRLKPQVCHTSNDSYATRAKGICPKIQLLPLFGNIPIFAQETPGQIDELLPDLPEVADLQERSEWIVACLFGKITQSFEVSGAIEDLIQYAERSGKKVALLLLGRNGAHTDRFVNHLQVHARDGLRIIHGGPQESDTLSMLFQACDFGVAVSPVEIIGKSGAVAAMAEHGLPVLLTQWMQPQPARASGRVDGSGVIYEVQGFDWETFLNGKTGANSRLVEVARLMETSLTQYKCDS